MHKKKLFSSVIFFLIGITLFLFVYHNFDIKELIRALSDVKFGWIFVSVLLGIINIYIRALRWKMLISTMGYKPRTINLFFAVIILYFTNLIIPRGGEVSRCAVISKYENTPFVKLLGTVFVERLTDMFLFFLILTTVVIWQFSFFRTVINYPEVGLDFSSFHPKFMTVIMIVIPLCILVLLGIKFKLLRKIYLKIMHLKEEFIEGISVIRHMKGKFLYVVYTILIFFIWLLMLYTVFFAYAPTAELTFSAAILTDTYGTLAFLLPIQAGIGAWHFIVINCLFFFGIDKASGMIFALIAHTFTNLVFVLFGPIVLAILPLVNQKITKITK
jgi:uncharacterized protein (TIRG00374 family)